MSQQEQQTETVDPETGEVARAPLARRPDAAPMQQQRREAAPVVAQQQIAAPRTSAATDKIIGALAAAQLEFGSVVKSRENTHFKAMYANLSDISAAVMPALKKHGIVPMQIPAGNRVFVRLVHGPSGEWIEGSLQIVPPDQRGGVQALGSALTYTRRYLLTMMLGIVAADEDDDGEQAHGRGGRAA